MRVLFDQGTPVPLREFLQGHEVTTAFEMGWSDLSNGDLLAIAEKQFDVLSQRISSYATSRIFRGEELLFSCCHLQAGRNWRERPPRSERPSPD
ncbi:MAG: hypothetical protein WAO00_11390 [Chthoniobacterales bacterium]